MKGVLFKYDADPYDRCLRDKCDILLCAGFIDPDFWSNSYPAWSICGPYIRHSLSVGDYIFFLPKKWSYIAAGYQNFICAGILKVIEVIPSWIEVQAKHWVSPTYQNNYVVDLAKHLNRDSTDAPKTQRIRPRNIIVGEPNDSIWFGKNTLDLITALNSLNIRINLDARRIRNLNGPEANQLYNYYRKVIKAYSPQC